MSLLFLLLLCLVCVYKLRFVKTNEHYVCRDTTAAVKGVFIVLVMLSHAKSYVTLSDGVFDSAYGFIINRIGQLMVAIFLFYSGYGVLESYKSKPDYEKGFLKNRIVKTLFHFDIAVLAFAILSLCLHIPHSTAQWLLCWTGWESVGNSNWYIFVILVCYFIAWLSFIVAKKLKRSFGFVCVLALIGTGVAAAVLFACGKGSYWYNTILCFPCGMAFSHRRDYFEKVLNFSTAGYFLTLLFGGIVFAVLYLSGSTVLYMLCACVFCLLIEIVLYKVQFGNCVLKWLGEHLFEIYILQRIPMIVLDRFFALDPFVFTAISIGCTLPLAWGFKKLLVWLDNKLFFGKR